MSDRIRRAHFVPLESSDSVNFKYRAIQSLNSRCKKSFQDWKRRFNSVKQKPSLWAAEVDWQKTRYDLMVWFIEAGIEGFTANFATHFLLGVDFNIMTMFAHGFAIKQGISIYWRLRRANGSIGNLPKKDK